MVSEPQVRRLSRVRRLCPISLAHVRTRARRPVLDLGLRFCRFIHGNAQFNKRFGKFGGQIRHLSLFDNCINPQLVLTAETLFYPPPLNSGAALLDHSLFLSLWPGTGSESSSWYRAIDLVGYK